MSKEFKKVKTWNQLLNDPRVLKDEIWLEDTNVGNLDWWIPLVDGFNYEGCSCIHEWSKKACIDSLNQVKKGEPY